MDKDLRFIMEGEEGDRIMKPLPGSWANYIINKLELYALHKEFRFNVCDPISVTEKYLMDAFRICLSKKYDVKRYMDMYNSLIMKRDCEFDCIDDFREEHTIISLTDNKHSGVYYGYNSEDKVIQVYNAKSGLDIENMVRMAYMQYKLDE